MSAALRWGLLRGLVVAGVVLGLPLARLAGQLINVWLHGPAVFYLHD